MRRVVIRNAFFLTLILAISACGATQTTVAQDSAPRYGGTLVVGMGKFSMLNPYVETAWETSIPASLVYDTFVQYWPDAPHWRGELAQSWDYTDGRSVTFHLRQNVKWHDGTPFTAQDAKWALETFDKYAGWAWFWAHKIDVSIVGDRDVKLTFDKPVDLDSIFVALGYLGYVIPRHLYEGTDMTTNPHNVDAVGTGPFKLVELVQGDHATFERNPNYYKEGLPFLDKVIVRIIPDETARFHALEKGEINYIPMYLPYSLLDQAMKEGKLRVDFLSAHGSINLLYMNLKNPILANKQVRQAIDYAIDKNDIIKKVTYGIDAYTGAFQHPDSFGWKLEPKYDYNPVKAKQMLDQAGYPVGTSGYRFKLKFLVNRDYTDHRMTGELVTQYLKDVGIDVDLVMLDKASTVQQLFVKMDFDLGTIDKVSTGPNPLWSLYTAVNSKMAGWPWCNPTGYGSDHVDQLLEEGVHTLNLTRKRDIIYELQDILAEDLPVINLRASTFPHVHDGKFIGIPEHFVSAHMAIASSPEWVWWTGGTLPATTAVVSTVTAGPTTAGIAPEWIAGVVAALVIVAVAGFYGGRRTRRS